MQLTLLESQAQFIRAGYSCPCGCHPSVTYVHGGDTVREGCCCGNEFALGPDAARSLEPREGFELQRSEVMTLWNERLDAAWLIGPSTHPAAPDTDAAEQPHMQHAGSVDATSGALDPVCGMTVDPDGAQAKGLHSRHRDVDYYFCGKGCKLDFDEDPEKYLDSSYVPSM
jgi:YHS domain-containing protein